MLEDEIGKGQPYKTLDIPEDYHSVEVMLALSSAVNRINKESLDLRHLQQQYIKKGKIDGHIITYKGGETCSLRNLKESGQL
jgi:hypothetical protein